MKYVFSILMTAITVATIAGCIASESEQQTFISPIEPEETKVQYINFVEPLYIEGRIQHFDYSDEPIVIIVDLKSLR